MTDRSHLRVAPCEPDGVTPAAAQDRLDLPLEDRYRCIRAASLALTDPLTAEDCGLQSMPDASPVKWHLAHTSWFFETFILAGVGGYRPFDPAFRMLFNSYYNGVGDKHPRTQRGLLSRPSLDEVRAYRNHVDAAMSALPPLARDFALPLIELGMQHEQQHQELILTDIKHALACNPLRPVYLPRDAALDGGGTPSGLSWISFAEGIVEIGADGTCFAFDNELPRHRHYAHAFELASRTVTNGEYLAFMADGGYTRSELWLSEGWDWINANRVEAPLYWERASGEWCAFTLHGMRALELDAPVCHVSLFEADAYAHWMNARLPTEAEWESAAANAPLEGHFVEDGIFHPRAPEAGAAMNPAPLMYGDVWQWTQSAYSPYPGFRTAHGAIGEYNGKFMCNQFVLRGGSCVSPRSHLRASYRNFFPASARWQFSGIRLARDAR